MSGSYCESSPTGRLWPICACRESEGNRPVSPVLTGRYELCGKPDCGLGRSDIPGQKLVDAIDWMLGDTL